MENTTAMRTTDISTEEWMNPENGWALYRSFTTAEQRDWYFNRLPDEDDRHFRVVRHPARYFIAVRESFAHRN